MARYCLLMGLAIFAMWAGFLATGQVPELTAAPLRTLGHLAAEFLTGAVLIMGGAGLRLRGDWGMPLTFAGLGLLLYALVQAIGYWLQLGNLVLAALFVALLAPASRSPWMAARPARQHVVCHCANVRLFCPAG